MRIILLIALAFLSFSARAVVVLDFDRLHPGFYPSNLESQGFRISPLCHFDIEGFGAPTNSLGFDNSVCTVPGGFNTDYLGLSSANANVFIDMSGQLFSLLSFDSWGQAGFIESSNSARISYGPNVGPLFEHNVLSGSGWTDIRFIHVWSDCSGLPCSLLDNLTFQVPEPETYALMLAGLAVVGSIARRRRLRARATPPSGLPAPKIPA
jgi:hypothetical protein